MINWQLSTPVAFLVFNRPDTTERVFEEIRRVRPPKLLIVADGARPDKPGEAEKVSAVRAIVEQVDWPCEVLKNYSQTNLGCKRRISSGLDWVFQMVAEAIVLEDDCLPHPSFFRFCEELLEKYRNDERIMHICGDNFQYRYKHGDNSYYFSRYAHVWGWASWRRAWQHYDVDILDWKAIIDKDRFLRAFFGRTERRFWITMFDNIVAAKIDTWDIQWVFACLKENSLCVVPNVNLISNIGFGSNSTHTKNGSFLAELPTVAIEFPLSHPNLFTQNVDADEHVGRLFFRNPSIGRYIVRQILRLIIR